MEHPKIDDTNIFVKFLPSSVNDEGLKNLFCAFGEIVSAKVMLDTYTWKSLGYGFVKFSTKEEANLAVQKMSGHRLGNKVLLCKLSNYSNVTNPSPNVYIKPLPFSFTEEKLKKIFRDFGEVMSAKIVRSQEKMNDVIGLVRFKNADCAAEAIKALNGTHLISDWRKLTVKYAETEAQRKTRKAHSTQFNAQGQIVSPNPTDLVPNYIPEFPPTNYVCMGECCQLRTPIIYLPLPPEMSAPPGWYNAYTNTTYPSSN